MTYNLILYQGRTQGGGARGGLGPPPPPKLTPAGLNESCKDWTFNKIGLLASLADLGTPPPLSAPPLRKSCVRPCILCCRPDQEIRRPMPCSYISGRHTLAMVSLSRYYHLYTTELFPRDPIETFLRNRNPQNHCFAFSTFLDLKAILDKKEVWFISCVGINNLSACNGVTYLRNNIHISNMYFKRGALLRHPI